ncbi:hypothetical protein [Streptomyces rhizosphaericus]|uniref:Uncharacterized protein n=1 Tax=Streptomyces rhizosphaericus TaxID=114699 RepID=A0A6G4AP16_9ACTN|nr:hypothetical protein [Streptomyces rhizosphaericus]NEW74992.1 hypothetical protein [Streptomyces rhizosphaericus]
MLIEDQGERRPLLTLGEARAVVTLLQLLSEQGGEGLTSRPNWCTAWHAGSSLHSSRLARPGIYYRKGCRINSADILQLAGTLAVPVITAMVGGITLVVKDYRNDRSAEHRSKVQLQQAVAQALDPNSAASRLAGGQGAGCAGVA